MRRLTHWLARHGRLRIIYDHVLPGVQYLLRYHLLFVHRPSWFPFNIFLHRILRADGDSLHDHPWAFVSMVLRGSYDEERPGRPTATRGPGSIAFRRSTDLHRIARLHGEVWTLVIVFRRVRVWGFLTARGWVSWDRHLAGRHDVSGNHTD